MTDHGATTAAGRAAPAPPGRWQVTVGSARGVAHQAAGLPNQDAVAYRDAAGRDGAVIVAVADGHGHSRHFRSGTGSALAVDTACQVAAAVSAGLAARAQQAALSLADVDAAVSAGLAPALVADWRAAVAGHLAQHPFTPEEQAGLDALGDDPEIPYGATLLVVTVLARWLICAQIGDGDILAIRPDGQSFSPVPTLEKLDGERTRSLCQPDALNAFRVHVFDLDARPLAALLLATDGYGNSQMADPWQPGVGRDLARFAAEHDHDWFERQVPGWAERCASALGSGDDTTIALVVHPDPAGAAAAAAAAAAARQAGGAGLDAADAETLPAGPGPDPAPRTVPVPVLPPEVLPPAGVPPAEVPAEGPATETMELDRAEPEAPGGGERTLPIRKAVPPGGAGSAEAGRARAPGRGAPRPVAPASPGGGGAPAPPVPPPSLPRVQVPGARGSGPRGPGPGGLPPSAGITSSRRTVIMIAGAIGLAALVAVIVVLFALRPAPAPAPAPARHAQPASQTSAATGPQPAGSATASGGTGGTSKTGGTSRQSTSGRSAGTQHEGDG
jgi:hypothetical protein